MIARVGVRLLYCLARLVEGLASASIVALAMECVFCLSGITKCGFAGLGIVF